MTTTISATMNQVLKVMETLGNSDPTVAQNPSYQGNLGLSSQRYDAGTTPDGTAYWSGHVNLVAGALSIDLTSLLQVATGFTKDMTGLKLREFQCIADHTNSNPMSIGTGATNGYAELGTLSNLKADSAVMRHCVGASAVDGTHKTLDLAGVGTDGMSILMVFGAT